MEAIWEPKKLPRAHVVSPPGNGNPGKSWEIIGFYLQSMANFLEIMGNSPKSRAEA
jgi:hypothetical protein